MRGSLASAGSRACSAAQHWPVMTSGSGSTGLAVALPGEGDVGLGFTRGSGLGFLIGSGLGII